MGGLVQSNNTSPTNKDRHRTNVERDPFSDPNYNPNLNICNLEMANTDNNCNTTCNTSPSTSNVSRKKGTLGLKSRSEKLRRRFSLNHLRTAVSFIPSPTLTHQRSMSHPLESNKDENHRSLEVRYHNKTEKSAEHKESSSPTIALPPSPEATEVAMRFLTSIYCDPPSPPSVSPSP